MGDEKAGEDEQEKTSLAAASHLGEESGDEGFCSASAAGQQNWCKTVSFLQEKKNKQVSVQLTQQKTQVCSKGMVTPNDVERET